MTALLEAALAGALIPFGAALALARLGARPGPATLAGLAVPLGFLLAFWLMLDVPDWPPGTARARLFAAVAGLAGLGALADLARMGAGRLAAIGLPLTAVWVGHPALFPDPWSAGALLAAPALVAGLALSRLALGGRARPAALGGAMAALALGLAGLDFLAAAGTQARLGLALAAAFAGWTLGIGTAGAGRGGWLLGGGGALGGLAAIQLSFGGLAPWVLAPLAAVFLAPLLAAGRGAGAAFLIALAPVALALGLAGWDAGLYG